MPATTPRMMLEHANIACRDAAAITLFLTTAFPEFRLRGSGTGAAGRHWRHVGNDEFYVAITEVETASARKPYSGSVGLNHLGWVVDDVDALESRMRAAGFKPNLKEHEHPARKRTYFYDPDGTDWEFVQYLTDDKQQRNDYSR